MCRTIRIFVLLVSALILLPMKAQELLNYPLDTINGEEVYRYQVERSVGLYRIGVNFGVSQAEIIRLNPQLNERGVHYGETLLIPTGRVSIKETQPVVVQTTVIETTVPVSEETPVVPDSISVNTLQSDTTGIIDLALLLPFESQQTKRSNAADRMLEFYQGVLLALQDLQNDSTRFRLHVIDTERSERRINALCDSTELEGVRGIIGPVYPIQIERMTAWCDTHQVPILLPFSDDSQLTKKSHVLQFNATDRQEADSLCEWIIARDSLIHCVAVDVREADMTEYVRTLREQMRRHAIPCATMTLRDLLNDSVVYALDREKENLIILHSDKFQHIRILLPHLKQLQTLGYSIRIVSQYSWLKEDISLPQVYTTMFTSDADRTAYDAQWSTYYIGGHASDLPRYDLLGYDLTHALVAWLQGKHETVGLQSVIRWKQENVKGFQNEGVQVMIK